jgi:hypothetical protein
MQQKLCWHHHALKGHLACGATTSLDALLGHGDASKAFVASLALVGDLAQPLVKYLGCCFRSWVTVVTTLNLLSINILSNFTNKLCCTFKCQVTVL